MDNSSRHLLNKVALLAEGVDRNYADDRLAETETGSPSSRRAWIEILRPLYGRRAKLVALLAEGVDRNDTAGLVKANELLSPSSRRAWIEILSRSVHFKPSNCRPPRGGRG